MKWSQIKRIISLTLCVLMVLALLPTSTLAEDAATPEVTSAPAESATSEPAATAAPEATAPAEATASAEATLPAEGEATPTPVPEETSGTAEETPLPSETPLVDLIPEGPVTFVVNFVIDGETIWDMQQTVAEGDTVSPPRIPAVPDGEAYVGQVFLYWYERANEAYNFDTPVSGNLTLYANFGVTEEAPATEEEPVVADEGVLFAAFSMAGGILPETTPLWTYTFVVDGTTIDTKIIADGDTLDAPAVPEAPEGQKFSGWYTDGTLFDSFGIQTVTESGATTLTAQFEPAYYVFFYNQFGSVFKTVVPDETGVVTIPGSTELALAADTALVGWSLTPGGTTDVGASVTVDGANISLYPIIKDVVWITFVSDGGTYIMPMYILPDTALTQTAVNDYVASQNGGSSTITKVGYTFNGWTGFTFGNMPTGNVTLTASWTPQTVGYTVLFWQQAVVGDSYAVYATDTVTTRTATAGTSVSPQTADTTKSYKGFDYNATKSVAVTVNGDGSTVLNVYYDRETWTVNWLMRTKTATGGYSSYNGFTTWQTRSGRYGSKVGYWPLIADINAYYNNGYTFTGWSANDESNGTRLTYLEIYDDGGSQLFFSGTLNLYGQFTNRGTTTLNINHYLQNLNLSWPSSATVTAYAFNSSSFNVNNRFEGFTAAYYNTNANATWQTVTPGVTNVDTNSLSTLNIRHTRNSYNLTVFNFNVQLSTTSVLYEMPLSGYTPAQPSKPAGISSDYIWAGWYTTQEGFAGSELNWSTGTMPAHDLIIYGVWKEPTFTGIAHSVSFGSSGGTTVDLGVIPYGGTISASALAEAQAAANASKPYPTDTFGGWMILKNGSLVLFNASMQIYENVVLYPIWISALHYSVTYSLGDASGTAPTDSQTYAPNSLAQVKALDLAAVTPPAEKVFIGWRSSLDNKIYYPNSVITMTGDTTLTAVWVYSAYMVTITYDGNGGATSGGDTTFTGGALNNTYHTVQGNSFLYTGKVFTGWNTAADGSGTTYQPGASVLLGLSVATAPGTLYAMWEDQTFDVDVTANPTAGLSAKSGAGIYVYHSNATITWTLAEGYELISVTDNGTTVPAASYTGNQYTISSISEDHDVMINTQKTLFTLTYDGNGGMAGGNASYSSTKTMGTSFTVDANTFTRDGYYFLGWSTVAGATEADPAYAPSTSVVMPSSNLTLYAVWAPKIALTLTANSLTENYDGSVKSVSGITPSIAGITVENTTASASGTNPGVYPTSFTDQAGLVLMSGGVDVTERYTVSWVAGSLTINPQVTYRASANGAVLGTEWVDYGTGDATYNVTPPQNITVGTLNFHWLGTYNPATANDLTVNTTIYASYSQNKSLVITADSATYTYDGTTRSVTTGSVNVPDVTVTGYTVSGSGADAGTYPTSVTLGTVKVMSGTTDVTYQYDVTTADGLLTITPANTTADSDGYTGKYDGDPHGITVTPAIDGSVIKYSLSNSTDPDDFTLTASPTATDYTPGTTVYFVVTNPNYNPVFGSEVIEIDKRVIALTTEDASKMYDGTALTNPNWSYNSTGNDGFVAGQGFATAAADGTITNVGSTNNTFAYTLTAVTNPVNYTIDATYGTLTVTASDALTVDAADVSEKYDGNAYGVTASANEPDGTVIRYSLTNSANPADYTLTTSPTATHVDESMTVYFVATNPNYAPAFGSALVTITPREITLTADSQSRAYDGTALTDADVTISGDSFIGDDGYETLPTANGTITDVGSVTNPVIAGTLNATTLASDYAITPVAGALTVTKATLTVQADDDQIAYPADRPANADLTYTLVGGNVSGETPAYSGALGYDSALAADPLVPNTYVDAIVGGTLGLLNNGTFKAANYTLVVLPGDLTVVNGGFTVDLDGGSWTYDGHEHGTTLDGTNPTDTVEYFVSDGAGGWTSVGPTPPTITDVDDGPLDVKVVVTREGYDPAEDTATLTITPANTTADSDGYTGKYDGDPHGITVTPAIDGSVIKYSLSNSTDPDDFTLTASPTETDYTPGTTVYFVVTNPNYNPVFGSEVVQIDKRVIALTTENASKMYDGTALTNANWNYNSTGNDGFVAGQGFATAAADGTITNVGSTNNTFAYTLTAVTNPVNYTIDATYGTLTVTASDALTVDAADVSEKYDGNAYGVTASANEPDGTVIRYSLTNSANPADYTLTTSPTATHVDESMTVYFVATNPNYAPAFGSALVTITPRDLVVNTASATRVYNGLALNANGWSIDPAHDGFIGTQGFATSVTTGAITSVGTADNTFAYTLKSNTQSADYTITVVPGTLEVTQRTVLIAAVDAEKNYGSMDPAFTYTVRTGTIGGTIYYSILAADLAGVTVTVSRTGGDSDVGTYAGVLVPDVSATPAVAANYAFTTQNGAFTINPQVVYNRNTTDAVTGFPETQWFDLGVDAVVASADGVKRAGFRLVGWEDASTGDVIALGGTIPDIGRNYELNAVWEVALYNVTYDKNAIDTITGMPADQAGIMYGTNLTVSNKTPSRSGYDFLYWTTTDIDGTELTYTGGTAYSMPDNDVVFKAVWDPRSSPVYYHANGATGGTVEDGRFFTDSIVTIQGNMFSRPGYRFLGWSEASATAGVSRQPGDWFYMPARQLNFYAQWEKIEYTVTYIVTGGTGTLDGSEPYAVYTGLGYGDNMPVPTNPTLNGYTFDGWTSAIPATMPDGDVVIYGTMSLKDIDKEPEVVPEDETPLAGGPVWALLNLILTIATALASILMLIGLFGKKKEELDGEIIRETEKHAFTRVLTLVPGIGAIIAFILTENMRNPMVFTDRWTLLMVIIALVQLVLVIFGAKKDKEPKDEKFDEPVKGE